MNRPVIAITTGEPAGIGPEIALAAALAVRDRPWRIVLLGDRTMLAARAARIGLALPPGDGQPEQSASTDSLAVIDCPLTVACVPGTLDARNSRAVLAMLDRAIDGALAGEYAAIVTAPVQKSVINDAGIPFSGHTEYLAERTGTRRVVMMLAGGGMRVALATTHLALKDVPQALTHAGLVETLRIVDTDLRARFGIAAPRILVTGLNPHAGEGGYLGREEIDTIAPAIAAARAVGIDASGPYPADTLFQPKYLERCDAVLAMYHDQGLPVLKHASFGHGVNITLGLPIIRTSVDHGTALDLAADPASARTADPGSMRAALELAAAMAEASMATRTQHAAPAPQTP